MDLFAGNVADIAGGRAVAAVGLTWCKEEGLRKTLLINLSTLFSLGWPIQREDAIAAETADKKADATKNGEE